MHKATSIKTTIDTIKKPSKALHNALPIFVKHPTPIAIRGAKMIIKIAAAINKIRLIIDRLR